MTVHWLDQQQVELALIDGERLTLPPLAEVQQVVEEIDRRAAAAREVARGKADPPVAVTRRLLRTGRLVTGLAQAGWVLCMLVPWAVLRAPDAGPLKGWQVGVLLACALGFALLSVPATRRPRVHGYGVATWAGRIAWPDVQDVVVAPVPDPRGKLVEAVYLQTARGPVQFGGEPGDVDQIRHYLRYREAWRTAEFHAAGPRPVPDNALSLARETGQDATERGLSRSADAEGDH